MKTFAWSIIWLLWISPMVLSQSGSICGDGIFDPGEECDDNNTISGDGCDGNCQIESGWICTKINPGSCWVRTSTKTCSLASFNLPPLMDLGNDTYGGFEGGLYAEGLNTRATSHEAAGVAIANSIEPLNSTGDSDPAGNIAMISVGMSNTHMEFAFFVNDFNTDGAVLVVQYRKRMAR